MSDEFPALAAADKRRIVIGALVSMFLAALDQTIVAPTLPTLGEAFGDYHWLPWVVSAYLLASTAVTPLYGKLADIKGRRPVQFAAIGIFLVGSVVCAMAPSMAILILGRAIQGLGGGGLIALAQTIIADAVPPRERGHYVVYITGLWASASIAGPVLGGLLTQHVHWSSIFWINLPIGLVAIALSYRTLGKLPDTRRPHKIDFLGSALIVSATVSILLALTWAGQGTPWGSPTVLGLIATGLGLFAVFAWHLTQTDEPLVPVRVLTNPIVASGTSSIMFSAGMNVGISVFIPVYLEGVHGLPPAQAGMGLLALLIGTVLGANQSGRLLRQVTRYKRIAIVGGSMAALAYATLAVVVPWSPVWLASILFMVVGAGVGTQFPVVTVSVQNSVSRHDLGVTTGLLAFLRSFGGVFGVATIGAIVLSAGVTAGHGGESMRLEPGTSSDALGHAFRWVFVAATIAQVIATSILLRMEERPLRGDGEMPAPVVE